MDPRARKLVRKLVMQVNIPIAKRRFRRALAKTPRPIALEVGGITQRPGWFNVNVNATTMRYMDGTRPWRFEDGSLSYVYADNMIEHVPLSGARTFLAEAYRCLLPGGTIRIVTPDVRHHVELYLAGRESVDSEIAGVYRSIGVVVEHPIDLLRTPIGEFGHHAGYVYDFETLDFEVQRAGFGAARRFPISESDDPFLADLEVRSAEGPAQLVIEATKPRSA